MVRLTELQRFEVKILFDSGVTIHMLSKRFGVSKKTIRSWCMRERGDQNDKPRRCGFRKLSPGVRKKIWIDVTQNGMSLRKTGKKYGISVRTVRNYVRDFAGKDDPVHPYRIPNEIYLSDEHKEKRRAYAEHYMSADFKQVCTVLFILKTINLKKKKNLKKKNFF